LRNGRVIEYDHIVLATGMNENIDAIPGLEAAWAHHDHPVYVPKGK
jgi:NADPH-dependent 2,4-dienoyl-CoA reductase/sulfur reductase-like enzyme